MSKPTIEQLREQVRAPVITADDPGYDDARAVHNGMFDRRPQVIIQAEQVADVIAGVNFARDAGLDLSVRGGGHSAPGFGTNDDGVVLDLSADALCRRRPARARHAPAAVPRGETSTTPRTPMGWQPPVGSSPRLASAG